MNSIYYKFQTALCRVLNKRNGRADREIRSIGSETIYERK